MTNDNGEFAKLKHAFSLRTASMAKFTARMDTCIFDPNKRYGEALEAAFKAFANRAGLVWKQPEDALNKVWRHILFLGSENARNVEQTFDLLSRDPAHFGELAKAKWYGSERPLRESAAFGATLKQIKAQYAIEVFDMIPDINDAKSSLDGKEYLFNERFRDVFGAEAAVVRKDCDVTSECPE